MCGTLGLAVSMLLICWVFGEVRKPSGPLGRRVVRAMSLSHARMTDWGLQQLAVPKNAAILDVGCGGGGPCANSPRRLQVAKFVWTTRRPAARRAVPVFLCLFPSAAPRGVPLRHAPPICFARPDSRQGR